ncbi:hypothetical protein [Streptomyces caeruleatus]|uniref:Vegetative cell wall protein gp1 n=1 Tax=Streptomyces caeruleatus TaxID=661399 RepID=A0A101TE00_9ACTN|nr:hypothetical protein [Streptomyces caeruleatus]KUN90529.1 hypothetical protein AQJ67_43975 [Streptomyces caeruleatus]
MNAFLTELGRNLAGRWAAVLALPAAVFVALAAAAVVLGPAHALDFALLRSRVTAVSTGPALVWTATGFLAATAAVGLAVTALGDVVTGSWGATGTGIGRPFTALRHRRWHRAAARADTAIRAVLAAPDDRRARATARRAVLRRDAICETEPNGPTWAGDQLRAVADRVRRGTGLDLTTTWPRLWLVLPDAARAELTTVQERCASAARTPVWGMACLAVGAYWWPALVPGLWLLSVSPRRIRRSVGVYADLVEASVDMHGRDVAHQLGFELTGRLTPEIGAQMTEAFQKRHDCP